MLGKDSSNIFNLNVAWGFYFFFLFTPLIESAFKNVPQSWKILTSIHETY